jgi:hypothetical protein
MHADPTTSARLELLDAILLGIERRAEILALVEVAADYSTAQAEVCSLLALPPNLADAVLDLQFRRLTADAPAGLIAERAELHARTDG